jgi:hypothetical protein
LANAAENLASDGGWLTILAYKSTRLWFPSDVADTFDSLPSDLAAHALILAERAARVESQARDWASCPGWDRLVGDDTAAPILAKGPTETSRVWVYVRDDWPFGGKDPPTALLYASRDRTREHPERHLAGYAGILQADTFDGYSRIHRGPRSRGEWTHLQKATIIQKSSLSENL